MESRVTHEIWLFSVRLLAAHWFWMVWSSAQRRMSSPTRRWSPSCLSTHTPALRRWVESVPIQRRWAVCLPKLSKHAYCYLYIYSEYKHRIHVQQLDSRNLPDSLLLVHFALCDSRVGHFGDSSNFLTPPRRDRARDTILLSRDTILLNK